MSNTNEMLKWATSELQDIAGGDRELFEGLFSVSAAILDDMVMFYNTGKRHRGARRKKWSRLQFVSKHEELNHTDNDDVLLKKQHMEIVDMLYSAYCDGFNGIKR